MKNGKHVFLSLVILCSLALAACGGSSGGGGGGGGGPGPTTNDAPIADAGSDQLNVDISTTVSLDGSGSSDPDGDALTYSWSIVQAPSTSTAALSDATVVDPTFTPDVGGSYVFALVVSDGQLDSASDTVGIATSGSSAPVAQAGTDSYNRITEVALATELVAWDSLDADGDALTYHWTLDDKPSASTATVGETFSTTGNQPFTPDAVGIYTFILAVDDGVLEAAAELEVTVTALDSTIVHPSVDTFPLAIPDGDIVTGVTSTIAVSGAPTVLDYVRVAVNLEHPGPTTDLDVYLESPAGTLIALTIDNAYLFNNTLEPSIDLVFDNLLATGAVGSIPASAIFTPDQTLETFDGEDANGIWQLHVYDDTAANVGSLLGWRVVFPALPVIANAGPDQTVTANTGLAVTLDGSGSAAVSALPLSYTWSFIEAPSGSTASLDDATAVMPTFVPDLPGAYVLELVASDGSATGLPDRVTITSQPPIARISGPIFIDVGVSVVLDGTASSTLSGGGLIYSWQLTQAPAGSAAAMVMPSAAMPSFTPDVAGEYRVELVVDDGLASSEPVTKTMRTNDGSTLYASADAFPIAIVDNTTFTTTITVGSGVSSISLISVHMDITHTFTGDLDIYLISPDGVRVMLTTDNGGTGNNFTGTIFNDLADVSVVGSAAPFTGFYRPEEPLSVLDGTDANGVWTLEVTDDAGADIGTLNSWQLEIW